MLVIVLVSKQDNRKLLNCHLTKQNPLYKEKLYKKKHKIIYIKTNKSS